MTFKRSLVNGIGVNDYNAPVKVYGVVIPAYRAWTSMLSRCYSKKRLDRFDSYIGCYVCDSWLLFSNFKEWFDKNYVDGWQLDKDLIVNGNREYSPENCAYVPQQLNVLINSAKKIRGKYPLGVTYHKSSGRFRALVSIGSQQIHIGSFSNEIDAKNAYDRVKAKWVFSLTDEYMALYPENYKLMDVISSIRKRYTLEKSSDR